MTDNAKAADVLAKEVIIINHLNIDIETYSSVDIKKAGLYKYAMSDDFEILLFAYRLNGASVQVVDLTAGEQIPMDIYCTLTDPTVIKHAFNAAFEWFCLSRYLKIDPLSWVDQWRCTQLHGLYCGYTVGLGATGAAMGLPQDKQKDRACKALIDYFCKPCKPTKTNGERTRNLPKHAPEKWQLFVEYNGQDVVTESEIENRLSNFPVPDEVQKQWETDLTINYRGVALDMDLIKGALALGSNESERLSNEAKKLTGLSNPNSTKQLLSWFNEHGLDIPDLKKGTLSEVLKSDNLSDELRKVLELRQESSKTSLKKYDTLENCVCSDGRVRGLLQFYGANRTGRWAGRMVQPQNMPRTYISDLIDVAREQIKCQNADNLNVIFGSVQDTLSQLIRTALVSKDGCTLLDADFSAIEARVIAWLAGEQWRLDVFNSHGKIYEASASQMFNVPIERIKKGNPEYALRAKGKVAELALGYGGSSVALINMGALNMGLTEEELPGIVDLWRQSNPCIKRLWQQLNQAAINTVETGRVNTVRYVSFAREFDIQNGQDFLTILLPSGRKLFYTHPYLGENRFGGQSIYYWGMNQKTKKWQSQDTYGGKLTENIVQAIARDCLAVVIERLERQYGYHIVFHVHDEVIVERPEQEADLDQLVAIMKQPIPWAPGLPLNADGYVSKYFKKD